MQDSTHGARGPDSSSEMAAEVKVTLVSWDVSGWREGSTLVTNPMMSKAPRGPRSYVNVGPSVLLTNRFLVFVVVPAPPRLITGAALYL